VSIKGEATNEHASTAVEIGLNKKEKTTIVDFNKNNKILQ
jgi:hypothetical protein